MAGTLMLDRLVHRARRAGAVVRLLGDDQQLAAVEAGGVLRHLDPRGRRRPDAARSSGSPTPTKPQATLQVRQGDPGGGRLLPRPQRVLAGTDTTMPDARLQPPGSADVRAGRDSLLLASSTADRGRAQQPRPGRPDRGRAGRRRRCPAAGRHRRRRRRPGRDPPQRTPPGRQRRPGLGEERRRLARPRRPRRRRRCRWSTARHHGRTVLPADYVAEHVELDYARTIRRAQGLTVDHAHLVVTPGLSPGGVLRRRQPSPARHPAVRGVHDRRPARPSARTWPAPPATCSPRSSPAPASSRPPTKPSATPSPASAICVGWRSSTSTPSVSTSATATAPPPRPSIPGITADPAWPSVAQRLHRRRSRRHGTITDILSRAEQMGDYTDARSETSVLVFRLDLLLARTTPRRQTPRAGAGLAGVPPPTGGRPAVEQLPAGPVRRDRPTASPPWPATPNSSPRAG